MERRNVHPPGSRWYRTYRRIYQALAHPGVRQSAWRALVKLATLIKMERQVGVPRVGDLLVLAYLRFMVTSPYAADREEWERLIWQQAARHTPGVDDPTDWRRVACEDQAQRAFLALDHLWIWLEPEWNRSRPIPTKFVDMLVELAWELYEGRFRCEHELLGRLTQSRFVSPRATGRYLWNRCIA